MKATGRHVACEVCVKDLIVLDLDPLRLRDGLALDRENEGDPAVHTHPVELSFAGFDIKLHGSAGRHVESRLHDRALDIHQWRPVGQPAIARSAIFEDQILRRQLFGVMKGYFADLRMNGEGDSDALVHISRVVCLAEAAMVVVAHAGKPAETLDDARAGGAEQQPVHLEQA